MATHSSTLAWKIPWTEEPGRLQSMGLRRVEHDRVLAHVPKEVERAPGKESALNETLKRDSAGQKSRGKIF